MFISVMAPELGYTLGEIVSAEASATLAAMN